MKFETVLFDLDGTILDTNELILTSFMHALDTFFPGKYTREDVIPHMGDTLYKQMERFGPEIVNELVETYREHNLQVHDELVRAFPHVKEVVQALRKKGAKIGVVTTKQRQTATMGIRFLDIEADLDTVVCYDDTQHHKPHPEPVLTAVKRLQADAGRTLMVGDSQFDIQAARRAGVACCAVSWSLKGVEFLRRFHPNYIIDDLREVLDLVNGKQR